jgi:hypothetical protein
MGFPGKFVSVFRVLQGSLRMPASLFIIPFFIVFGCSAMGAGGKFVLFGGFPVCVVHRHVLRFFDVHDADHSQLLALSWVLARHLHGEQYEEATG